METGKSLAVDKTPPGAYGATLPEDGRDKRARCSAYNPSTNFPLDRQP